MNYQVDILRELLTVMNEYFFFNGRCIAYYNVVDEVPSYVDTLCDSIIQAVYKIDDSSIFSYVCHESFESRNTTNRYYFSITSAMCASWWVVKFDDV